jgi:hypothetical protein
MNESKDMIGSDRYCVIPEHGPTGSLTRLSLPSAPVSRPRGLQFVGRFLADILFRENNDDVSQMDDADNVDIALDIAHAAHENNVVSKRDVAFLIPSAIFPNILLWSTTSVIMAVGVWATTVGPSRTGIIILLHSTIVPILFLWISTPLVKMMGVWVTAAGSLRIGPVILSHSVIIPVPLLWISRPLIRMIGARVTAVGPLRIGPIILSHSIIASIIAPILLRISAPLILTTMGAQVIADGPSKN